MLRHVRAFRYLLLKEKQTSFHSKPKGRKESVKCDGHTGSQFFYCLQNNFLYVLKSRPSFPQGRPLKKKKAWGVFSWAGKEKSWPQFSGICAIIRPTSQTFSSVQLLSHAQLFATPWTAARQASLSITNSWSLLRLMSIELVMPSNHLIHKP